MLRFRIEWRLEIKDCEVMALKHLFFNIQFSFFSSLRVSSVSLERRTG